MNCKPGDLAWIVAPFEAAGRGLVVTVVEAAAAGLTCVAKNGGISSWPSAGGHAWICDSHDARFPCVIADEALRPIRDPGDDARDETLEWKQVPSREGQPA